MVIIKKNDFQKVVGSLAALVYPAVCDAANPIDTLIQGSVVLVTEKRWEWDFIVSYQRGGRVVKGWVRSTDLVYRTNTAA